MWELWYWCYQRGGEWRCLGGPDYDSHQQAIQSADRMSMSARRAIQVRNLYSGEVVYQTGEAPHPGTVNAPLHPALWG